MGDRTVTLTVVGVTGRVCWPRAVASTSIPCPPSAQLGVAVGLTPESLFPALSQLASLRVPPAVATTGRWRRKGRFSPASSAPEGACRWLRRLHTSGPSSHCRPARCPPE